MRGEPIELSCPFCDKGKISCWYIAGVWGEKRTGRSSLGSGKSVEKSSNIWLIKSGCNVCNKNQDEVERELKKKNII